MVVKFVPAYEVLAGEDGDPSEPERSFLTDRVCVRHAHVGPGLILEHDPVRAGITGRRITRVTDLLRVQCSVRPLVGVGDRVAVPVTHQVDQPQLALDAALGRTAEAVEHALPVVHLPTAVLVYSAELPVKGLQPGPVHTIPSVQQLATGAGE